MADAIDELIFGPSYEVGPVFQVPDLETIMTSPEWFNLSTATPMQRLVCRVADGLPIDDLIEPCQPQPGYAADIAERMTPQWAIAGQSAEEAKAYPEVFAAAVAALPKVPPRIFSWFSGVRCGKTLLMAGQLIRGSLIVDVSGLRPGETPRSSCLSLDKDKAAAVFDEHLLPAIERSPALRHLLIGEPRSSSTEKSLFLKHPNRGKVEIKVVAGKRAGAATISRWCATAVFDEAPRMLGQEDGVINLDEQEKATLGRLLPGGSIWEAGSPWAPMGPCHRAAMSFHGKPSRLQTVLRMAAPALNHYWWTPERCEEMREKLGDVFAADVLGEFIAVAMQLFGTDELKAILRKGDDLERHPRCHYVAVIDPATRSNAWTLVVGALYPDGVMRIAAAREWIPEGKPLVPKVVFSEIAEVCSNYGVRDLYTDQWAADFAATIASDVGLYLIDTTVTQKNTVEAFDSLRAMVRSRPPLIQVPDVVNLRDDLQRVQRKLTQDGVRMVLPHTSDGRHSDYAGVVARFIKAPMAQPSPEPVTPAKGEDWASWKDEQETQKRHTRVTGMHNSKVKFS